MDSCMYVCMDVRGDKWTDVWWMARRMDKHNSLLLLFLGSLPSSTTPAGPLGVLRSIVGCSKTGKKARLGGWAWRQDSRSSAHEIMQPSMGLLMDWPLLEVIHISRNKLHMQWHKNRHKEKRGQYSIFRSFGGFYWRTFCRRFYK